MVCKMNDEIKEKSQLIIFEPSEEPRTIYIDETEDLVDDRTPTYDESGNIITDYKVINDEIVEVSRSGEYDRIKSFIDNWEKQQPISQKRLNLLNRRRRNRQRKIALKEAMKSAMQSSVEQNSFQNDQSVAEEQAILQSMKMKEIRIRKIPNLKPKETTIDLNTNLDPKTNTKIEWRSKKRVDTVILDDSDSEWECEKDNICLNINTSDSSSNDFTKKKSYRSYKTFISDTPEKRRKRQKPEVVQISDEESDIECISLHSDVETISDEDDSSPKKTLIPSKENGNVSSHLEHLVDNFVSKYIKNALPFLPPAEIETKPESESVIIIDEQNQGKQKHVSFNDSIEEYDVEISNDPEITKTGSMQVSQDETFDDDSSSDCTTTNKRSNETSPCREDEISDDEIVKYDSRRARDFYDMIPSPDYTPYSCPFERSLSHLNERFDPPSPVTESIVLADSPPSKTSYTEHSVKNVSKRTECGIQTDHDSSEHYRNTTMPLHLKNLQRPQNEYYPETSIDDNTAGNNKSALKKHQSISTQTLECEDCESKMELKPPDRNNYCSRFPNKPPARGNFPRHFQQPQVFTNNPNQSPQYRMQKLNRPFQARVSSQAPTKMSPARLCSAQQSYTGDNFGPEETLQYSQSNSYSASLQNQNYSNYCDRDNKSENIQSFENLMQFNQPQRYPFRGNRFKRFQRGNQNQNNRFSYSRYQSPETYSPCFQQNRQLGPCNTSSPSNIVSNQYSFNNTTSQQNNRPPFPCVQEQLFTRRTTVPPIKNHFNLGTHDENYNTTEPRKVQDYELSVKQNLQKDSNNDTFRWDNGTTFDYVAIPNVMTSKSPPWVNKSDIAGISRRCWIDQCS